MNAFSIGRCACIGIISIGTPLFAQTATTPTFSQAVTTGLVSLSLNQAAQLNVLNLNPVPAKPSAATACTVEMEFRDGQNNLLKQLVVPNVPPGDVATLTLERSEATSTTVARFAIRGIVRTGLIPASASTTPIANNCIVMPTLEIFNGGTGDTQLVTSDTRPISAPIAIPLAH